MSGITETQLSMLLNKLCKWRLVFAGWQLGTRPDTDPECQAVRDQRDLLIMLRVESSAISALMIKAGVFSRQQFMDQLAAEALALDDAYQRKFPGFRSTNVGMEMDAQLAAETMKGWRP